MQQRQSHKEWHERKVQQCDNSELEMLGSTESTDNVSGCSTAPKFAAKGKPAASREDVLRRLVMRRPPACIKVAGLSARAMHGDKPFQN